MASRSRGSSARIAVYDLIASEEFENFSIMIEAISRCSLTSVAVSVVCSTFCWSTRTRSGQRFIAVNCSTRAFSAISLPGCSSRMAW